MCVLPLATACGLVLAASGPAEVREATFASASLGRWATYTVVLPPGHGEPGRRFPVLYLLHGMGDDHTTWSRHTDVAGYAAKTGLIVVTPFADDHWYVNRLDQPSERTEDFIVHDLVGHIDATYATIPERSGRAIDGVSMGGYGAMVLGLKHPELFCSVGSHSGVLEFARLDSAEVTAMIGPPGSPSRADHNPAKLLERLITSGQPIPQLVFCVGADDSPILIGMSIAFMHLCRDHFKIPHIYRTDRGKHDYRFWDKMLAQAMRDHARAMQR